MRTALAAALIARGHSEQDHPMTPELAGNPDPGDGATRPPRSCRTVHLPLPRHRPQRPRALRHLGGHKAGLAAKVEQWYRQRWPELTVVTGDGPVPPREDEELQVAGISRRPGERRRVCWYEAPGPVGRCSGTRELGKGGGDER